MLKKLLPILYFLSPIIVLIFYFRGNWYSFFHYWSIGVWTGVMGYCYLLNQFITGGRVKWLDRLYGYDRILVFHRYTAFLAIACILIHEQLKDIEADLVEMLGDISLTIFIVTIILALLFLSNVLSGISLFAHMRAFLQRRFRLQYQHFRAIHNLTAIAMLFGLAHVIVAASTRETVYRIIIISLWYCVATGTYIRAKFIIPHRQKKNPFTVTAVTRILPNITTVQFAPQIQSAPAGNAFPYHYNPGQFCFVRFIKSDMTKDEHPFTISSAPKNGTISITAKNLGDWSKDIAVRAKVGDTVAVDGPYGIFSYKTLSATHTNAPLIYIAGGIGITPCIAMLESLGNERSKRSIRLLWKVKKSEELFLKSKIKQWKTQLPDFKYEGFVSEKSQQRITISTMCTHLTPTELSFGQFYFCGPSRLLHALKSYLKTNGVKRSHLYHEKFNF